MSLNWKEINLILEELDLIGSQIQKAVQSAFDLLSLKIYGKTGAKTLLISLSPAACRLHETFSSVPKSNKPLRFAEFLNSRLVNGRIEEALQLGEDRIIRLKVRCSAEDNGHHHYYLYIRLWSNAANVIVTDLEGLVLDAMKRLPKKKEVTGGCYKPEAENRVIYDSIYASYITSNSTSKKEYQFREFSDELLAGLPPESSFNQKIDAFYRMEGGSLSLDSLQIQARKKFEERINRLGSSIERLKEKYVEFEGADQYREYGDLILSNLSKIGPGENWLEAMAYSGEERVLRIKLDPVKGPKASAEGYYEQYRKAKSGIEELRISIEREEEQKRKLEETLFSLLSETNPLILNKLLKTDGKKSSPTQKEDDKRPGLSFRRKDWLIIVGRSAAENDALLRKHVKGNDLWLHARDYAGSYVFIRQRPGKSVPLDILLDAGNLAIFYSKGRNNGAGDLFYTPVKNLKRVKGGPAGLVIPTNEKNLHVKVDEKRLVELDECKVDKST
ncbi:MAG: NFACT family protein [Treponema sp.]|nr:NFACT family protein [Treponema sp.]